MQKKPIYKIYTQNTIHPPSKGSQGISIKQKPSEGCHFP